MIGTVWPYIMVGFIAIGIVMTGILQNFLRKDSEPHPKTTLKKIIQVIVVVFYFTLPSVSKNTFDAIKCVSFRTNDEAEDNLESYLLADMTIRCDSDDSNFSTLKGLFWVFFTLWPVLTPLIFMVLLTKIIQQLESLLPRPRVLLSTDDAQDMDEVKFAVSTCATFILNYRAGYFRSTKCRQELVAAFEDDMPVIIIYEGEEASLLDKLRIECVTYFDNEPSSADILEHIFKHDPILWLHDDNDYHLAASMKKVYYFLLKSLPYYQGDRAELLDHGITVPGELGKVILPCPLTILVCEGNEGAIQVASELLTLTGTGTTKLEILGKSTADDDDIDDKIVSKETFVDDIIPESSEAVYDLSGERKMILFLYLNRDTFSDDGASVQSLVRAAKDSMVDIVLVHEKDSTNGCHFNHILEQTPIELIEHPYRLFDETAIPLYSPSEHRFINLRQILIRMGAVAKT